VSTAPHNISLADLADSVVRVGDGRGFVVRPDDAS
jgi:hypothetical protein